ncbi:MAG TPA: hypothetical protein VLA04_00045 [Verrucomicrobiae bacterium]|nr:hypothetical protein [Verrucomicrobiae bacterium]
MSFLAKVREAIERRQPLEGIEREIPTSLEEAYSLRLVTREYVASICLQLAGYKTLPEEEQVRLEDWHRRARSARVFFELEVVLLTEYIEAETKRLEEAEGAEVKRLEALKRGQEVEAQRLAKAARLIEEEKKDVEKRKFLLEKANLSNPNDPECLLWAMYTHAKFLTDTEGVKLTEEHRAVMRITGGFLFRNEPQS